MVSSVGPQREKSVRRTCGRYRCCRQEKQVRSRFVIKQEKRTSSLEDLNSDLSRSGRGDFDVLDREGLGGFPGDGGLAVCIGRKGDGVGKGFRAELKVSWG